MSLEAAEVVGHAVDSLKAIAPSVTVERKGESALLVRLGERGGVWNLADVIRMASQDPSWREGVTALARQVVAQFSGKQTEGEVALRPDNVVVLVWPQAKLDNFGFEVVSEQLVPGLVFFYGVRGGGKIRSIKPDELQASGLDLPSLRRHAFANLGLSAEQLGLGPLQEGAPILTNHVGSACAASLLSDTPTWEQLSKKFGPVLVAVPSPSRLFIGPDAPAIANILRQLVERSLEVEEEVLTIQLLRFDGARWAIAPTTT